MRLIEPKNLEKEITEKCSYDFDLADDGLYLIEVIASAKSWWQNLKSFKSLLNNDNLALVLDRIEISSSLSNETNARAAWHGNELKGFLKTVLIAIRLKKGKHVLSFTPSQSPFLKSITVSQVEETDSLIYIPTDKMAQKGNSRPWLSLVTINLSIKDITISAKADKRGRDDDDIKLIIDGVTQKNQDKKSHKDWYWCGKLLKGKEKEFKKIVNFNGAVHSIDLWADEAPFLEKIVLSLINKNTEITIRPYLYRGTNGQEDYNRYDTDIAAETNYWNDKFKNDIDPVQEILDPNLVKAMIFQESRMGYGEEAGINIMQVGNDGDASLKTLRGELKEYWLHDGKEVLLKYDDAIINKPKDSIKWGIRWLYHKAQWIGNDGKRHWNSWREAVKGYGPPNEEYSNNIWDIYTRGIDKRGKFPVKLWLIFIPFALFVLLSGAFWLHNNQGRVFISYHEAAKNPEWLCDGESWVDISVLDGLRIKKVKIKNVQIEPGDCLGLKKGSLKYSYTDLDNDGKYDLVLAGEWGFGKQVKYFLKSQKDRLSIISVKNSDFYPEALNGQMVYLTWPEENGKYTFAVDDVIDRVIYRNLYHFNNGGEIELYRRETEELTGDISKFGKITEMPL